MSQAITKLATGRGEEGNNAEEIASIIEQCYDSLFADTTNIHNLADFYHKICQTIEEINTKLGNTQFRIPSTKTLEKIFKEEHEKESCQHLTKEEFVKILLHVIFETGITGTRAKEMLFFLFGFLSNFQEHHHSKRNEKSSADTRLAGGARDILLFIFGVPITTLFLKQRLIPTAIPNEVFIPGVTSATVFFLAKLKKI